MLFAAMMLRDPLEPFGSVIQAVCLILLIVLTGVLLLRWVLGTSAMLKRQEETNRLLAEIRDKLSSKP
jgi:hypothetical protein